MEGWECETGLGRGGGDPGMAPQIRERRLADVNPIR